MKLLILFSLVLISFQQGEEEIGDVQEIQNQNVEPEAVVENEPEARECTNQFNIPLHVQHLQVTQNCLIGQLDSTVPIRISQALKATNLHAHQIHTPGIHVRYVHPLNADKPIVINGSLVVQRVQIEEVESLEILMVQKKQKFWKMTHHLNFEDEHINVSECPKITGGKFLGGHCLLTSQEITRSFILPPHNNVRLELNLHVFDDWDKEVISIYAGETIIYRNQFTNSQTSQDLCGNSRFGDDHINVKVEKTFPHTGNNLILKIKAETQKHPCQSSFGVDNIIINIK